MDQPKSATPHQLNSSEVVFRFALRLALLSMFATFGAQGFARTFAALLALSVIFCVVMGTMRREALFGPMLTHWDEAAAYGRHWSSGFCALLTNLSASQRSLYRTYEIWSDSLSNSYAPMSTLAARVE
jgi:hypothetical protein